MNILFIKFKEDVGLADRADYLSLINEKMAKYHKDDILVLENTLIEELRVEEKIDEVKEYKIGDDCK